MIAAEPAAQVAENSQVEIELSIVMPCLDEERTLVKCIEKARRAMDHLGVSGEVIVADNGSTDRSAELAMAAGARVVHQHLPGYGNALRLGLAEARGKYLIMGDCDESYDFSDLERFLIRLRNGADLVVGNRFAGEIKPGAMPWLHRWFGNPFLSRLLNLLYGTGVGDSFCGMRGFSKVAFEKMHLRMPGMEFALEMVIKASLIHLKIEEIPITLWPDGRDRRPHLRSFRDGWRGLRFMLMCSPMFLFVVPGVVFALAGLTAIPAVIWAGYGVFTGRWGPNFMYTTSLISILGWNLLIFGVLAKMYTYQVDPVFQNERTSRLVRMFSLERGLLLAVAMIVTAAFIGVPVLVEWFHTHEIPIPGRWIFASTLFVLGVETLFTAFLIGILDLPRKDGR